LHPECGPKRYYPVKDGVAGVIKLSPTQQAEAIKMIRLGAKSQAEIAELFNVDRSTISRMMKEVWERELVKAVR
jgi:DNA-binding MarR family transcriptional regulator